MNAAVEAPEQLPRVFGPYTLLAHIGRGGMGDVFLARHDATAADAVDPLCVIKSLRNDLVTNREYIDRFIDEARTVVRLSHPNVCQVFDVGLIDGRYYLAMEHVAGRDVRRIVEEAQAAGVAIPQGVALHIVRAVLDGLGYAHELRDAAGARLGIVHRDVSPQNVLVSFAGETRVIDFGLALSASKRARTEPGVIFGKIAYMAPEHVRSLSIDARADVFSCAIMCVELLIGARFYEGLARHEILAAAGNGTHRPKGFAQIQAPLRAVLERALAPAPDDRTATCARLRDELGAHVGATIVTDAVSPADVAALLERLFPGAARDERGQRDALVAGAHIDREPSTRAKVIASAPRVQREASGGSAKTEPTEKSLASTTEEENDQAAPAREATQIVARRPPQPEPTVVVRDRSASPPSPRPHTSSTTARTTTHVPRVIGVALGSVLLGIVVAFVVFSPSRQEPARAAPPPTTLAPPTLAPPTPAPPSTTVLSTAPAREPVDDVEPSAPQKPALAKPRTARPAPPVPPPPVPSPVPSPVVAAPPSPSPPPAVPRDAPRGAARQLVFLERWCPRLECTADARVRMATWAGLEKGAAVALTADIQRCVERCQE